MWKLCQFLLLLVIIHSILEPLQCFKKGWYKLKAVKYDNLLLEK